MSSKLRSLSILCALWCLASLPSNAQSSFYFPQIGDGVVGNIRFQTTILLVNTGADVTVELEFFSTGSGDSLSVSIEGLGTDDSFQIALSEGGSVALQTTGEGGIVVGYARVTDPRNLTDPPLLGGTAVFTRSEVDTDIILYEAGVPATRSLSTFTAFVDTIESLDTGLALVNIENFLAAAGQNGDPEVSLSLRDQDFVEIAQTVIPLSAGAHVAQYVGQFFDQVPEANEMRGSLVVDSPDAELVAVTLRQNDIPGVDFPGEVPTLTTFPVVPGAAGAVLAGSFTALDSDRLSVTIRLPHFAGVREARLRFLGGGEELASSSWNVSSRDVLSDVFVIPGLSRQVTRIEIELRGPGGEHRTYSLMR